MSKFRAWQHHFHWQDVVFYIRARCNDWYRQAYWVSEWWSQVIDTRQTQCNSQTNCDPDILGRGRIPQSTQDILAKIHGLTRTGNWRRPQLLSSLLATWKCNIKKKNEGIETTRKLIRTHRGRKTRAIMSDVLELSESRQHIRRLCGSEMQVIMGGMLQFFRYNTDEEWMVDVRCLVCRHPYLFGCTWWEANARCRETVLNVSHRTSMVICTDKTVRYCSVTMSLRGRCHYEVAGLCPLSIRHLQWLSQRCLPSRDSKRILRDISFIQLQLEWEWEKVPCTIVRYYYFWYSYGCSIDK